jgi:hypothetical protein
MFEIHEIVEGVLMKGLIEIKLIFKPYGHKINLKQLKD